MEKRTLYIGGGAVALALLAFWYYKRSSSSAAATDSSASGDMGGSTVLFTPPAPLSTSGATQYDAGQVATATGGTTTLAQDMNAATTSDNQNALQLGQQALLAKLTSDILAATPNSMLGQLQVSYVNGAIQVSNTPRVQPLKYLQAWSTPDASGVQYWNDRAGATETQQNGAVTVNTLGGTSYTQDQVRAWGAANEAAGNGAGIYDTLRAAGVSLDSYDLLMGRAAGSATTDTAEQWAIANGRTIF